MQLYRDEYNFFPPFALSTTIGSQTVSLEFSHFLDIPGRPQKVFACPSAPPEFALSMTDLLTPLPDRKRSYGANEIGSLHLGPPLYQGGGLFFQESSFHPWRCLPESRLVAPHAFIVLGDSQADGKLDAYLGTRASTADLVKQRWPGDRHKDGANMLFADAHVERRGQRDWLKRDPAVRRLWNWDHKPHEEAWWPDEQSIYDELLR